MLEALHCFSRHSEFAAELLAEPLETRMFDSILPIFLIGLVALASPGPDMFFILRSSMQGPLGGIKAMAGILTGCLCQISACILGISVLLKQNETVFRYVRWAGAVYLIYLGLKILLTTWKRRKAELVVIPGTEALPSESYFRDGFFCNLLNPQYTLFLVSLFAQFTGPQTPIHQRALYGVVLWFQAAVFWIGLVFVLQSHRIQPLLCRALRVADPILGVLLSALGIRIIVG